MWTQLPILSIVIWLPLIGAVLCLCTGSDKNANIARTIAVIVALASFLLCIPLYLGFDAGRYDMQYVENVLWIRAYKINYALGIDGISLVMVILTNFTGLLVVIAGCHAIKVRVAQYMAAFLVMQGMIVGVFCAMDAILFYVFWEGMLIPMYLSIGMWGSSNRSYASIKFFLFTFLGSILMLVALIYLYNQTGSFMIQDFYGLALSKTTEEWLFFAFLLAFAVKVPMWPVHTWLPDAHTEAPAGGSVVLAALMLKLGIYGFLRFSMPITPIACEKLAWLMIVLSLIAIVYIGLIAIVQSDMKKLIAYSSIAHMGFATLGCFMVYDIVQHMRTLQDAYMSLEGAVIQMVAHAFGSGAMFLGVGLLSERFYNHSRLIKDYGGVANTMPIFAAFFMLFAMSNVGLPGTAGFVGEFMIIMSAFQTHFWVAATASLTLILSASYTLWMYKRVFFGPIANEHVAQFKDITWLEKVNYILLAAGVFFVGLYPQPIIDVLRVTIGHLLLQSMPPGLAMNMPMSVNFA
ncbi:complex I subunit 4 family protein [Aquicella lusitana]|uniref:NADH-quinone oxidoreductase subunit M n=1 Tax=Aquicella lusitana TaxID=254246 RepID=A0A370GTA3_9COXI|nr:NADH-quinone oxidoreductase subunit M [Aquicella lusitana]RDI46917.1 NADH dehydrogenase subunit M [Aquicella lusitana]VVC73808.1 NADH-quinone oxidoreductase subunit M [Aquicella lusitana]